MADQFRYKLMTDLTAKDAPSDTDLVAVGNNGSSALRKLTFASIANAIKTKLLTWTFSNLTTSKKNLPEAINELNSNINHTNERVDRATISSVSIPSGSFTTLATITVSSAGYYMIETNVAFTAGSGIRILLVDSTETNSNTAVNSVLYEGRATAQKIRSFYLTTTNTVYIRAYQTTGANMTVSGYYELFRMK